MSEPSEETRQALFSDQDRRQNGKRAEQIHQRPPSGPPTDENVFLGCLCRFSPNFTSNRRRRLVVSALLSSVRLQGADGKVLVCHTDANTPVRFVVTGA